MSEHLPDPTPIAAAVAEKIDANTAKYVVLGVALVLIVGGAYIVAKKRHAQKVEAENGPKD